MPERGGVDKIDMAPHQLSEGDLIAMVDEAAEQIGTFHGGGIG